MAYQQTRGNFPKTADGNVYQPVFTQIVDTSGNLVTPDSGLLPGGTVAVGGTSGNVANAVAAATIAAVAAKMNYVTGIDITAAGATAAAVVTATLTGLAAGTQSFTFVAPAGATLAAQPLSIQFCPPLPASAVNTAITVSLPALGAGNTNAVANIRGLQI